MKKHSLFQGTNPLHMAKKNIRLSNSYGKIFSSILLLVMYFTSWILVVTIPAKFVFENYGNFWGFAMIFALIFLNRMFAWTVMAVSFVALFHGVTAPILSVIFFCFVLILVVFKR